MSRKLEIGRWYGFRGRPDSLKGRPVQILQVEGDLVHGKWASGLERVILCKHVGSQVDDAVPGVTEACLVCGGNGELPVFEASEDEPWVRKRVATKPCPNCRGLH